MITYCVPEGLPSRGVLLAPDDLDRFPRVLLFTREYAAQEGISFQGDAPEEWVDRILDVAEIDEDTARQTIATALGVNLGGIELRVEPVGEPNQPGDDSPEANDISARDFCEMLAVLTFSFRMQDLVVHPPTDGDVDPYDFFPPLRP